MPWRRMKRKIFDRVVSPRGVRCRPDASTEEVPLPLCGPSSEQRKWSSRHRARPRGCRITRVMVKGDG